MKHMVDATVGFAANPQGGGVAYVRVGNEMPGRVLRVPFSVKRYPALLDREVGYAALAAVGTSLRCRGIDRVRFVVDDVRLSSDLKEHRDVPQALALAYVRAGCALNQFSEYQISSSPAGENDLTARARSEVALSVAA